MPVIKILLCSYYEVMLCIIYKVRLFWTINFTSFLIHLDVNTRDLNSEYASIVCKVTSIQFEQIRNQNILRKMAHPY